jgi:hypothetical protein
VSTATPLAVSNPLNDAKTRPSPPKEESSAPEETDAIANPTDAARGSVTQIATRDFMPFAYRRIAANRLSS